MSKLLGFDNIIRPHTLGGWRTLSMQPRWCRTATTRGAAGGGRVGIAVAISLEIM